MKYNNGLHQFLQMKNNLPINHISVLTSYLSNLGYFKRYIKENGNFIYGMTGTLGSEKTRNLLKEIYHLDFDYIPTNTARILKELTSNISYNHENFLKNIRRIVKRETKGGRCILIICENIDTVNIIYDNIKEYCSNLRFIKIIGEDNDNSKIAKEMKQNTVIISTNISGRGTDLKLSKLILKNGGLHVIITFIPKNSRIEEQNYGRAGRRGEPGTWQLVLNYQKEGLKFFGNLNFESLYNHYINFINKEKNWNNIQKSINSYFTIDSFRDVREKIENLKLNDAKKNIEKVDKMDKLFNLYCKMIDERKELRKTENRVYLNSIEERWGIFLYNLKVFDKDWNKIENEFNEFKREIMKELDNDTVIKNAGYYNMYVSEKLGLNCDFEEEKSMKDSIKKKLKKKILNFFNKKEEFDYNNNINKCNKSISLDSNSFIPYYLRAICKIVKQNEGLEDLNKALLYIEKEIKEYKNFIFIFNSLNINFEYIISHIILLENIKKEFIEENIKIYENKKAKDLKVFKKYYNDIFSFNNDQIKDREIPEHLKKYFSEIKDNGLIYGFFLKKKVSRGKCILNFVLGFVCLGLSMSINYLIPGSIPLIEVFKKIGKFLLEKLGKNFMTHFLDDVLNGVNDREFRDYYNIGFFDIKKDRKKIRKFKLDEIFSKYDENYENKKIKEEIDTCINEFINKFKKLEINNIDLNIFDVNKYEKEFEDKENKKLYEKKIWLNNYLNNNQKLSLIGSFICGIGGRYFILRGLGQGKNIKEILSMNDYFLKKICEDKIKAQIILNLDEIKTNLNTKLYNQKNIIKGRKIMIKEKEKSILIKEQQINNDLYQYNMKLNFYKKNNYFNNNIFFNDNFSNNIHYESCPNLEEEKYRIDKAKERLNELKIDLYEEKKFLNNEINKEKVIDDVLKNSDFLNENIQIKLKDKMKIIFKEKIILSDFSLEIKKIEENCNILFEQTLQITAEILIENEKDNEIILFGQEIYNKFNDIKNLNLFWDNCYNKLIFPYDYVYSSDDMNKIINYKMKKLGRKYYYISDFYEKRNLINFSKAVKNKKIIFGNFFDKKIWNTFCLFPNLGYYFLLYKTSSPLKTIPKELINFINEIIKSNYIVKINKGNTKFYSELSEVDAIENIKIMFAHIKDYNFAENFENFSFFFNETKKAKEQYKRNIYPKDYIKSLYDEKKEKYKTSRIGLGLFKDLYLNKKKNNEIDFMYFDGIYEVLLNYEEIDKEEKEILTKEYNEIRNSFGNPKIKKLFNDDNSIISNNISLNNNNNISRYQSAKRLKNIKPENKSIKRLNSDLNNKEKNQRSFIQNKIISKKPSTPNKILSKKPSTPNKNLSKKPTPNKIISKKSTSNKIISKIPSTPNKNLYTKPSTPNKIISKKSTSNKIISKKPSTPNKNLYTKPSTPNKIISKKPSTPNKILSKKPSTPNKNLYTKTLTPNKIISKKPSTPNKILSKKPSKTKKNYIQNLQFQIKLYLKSLQLQIKIYLKNLQRQKNIYIQNVLQIKLYLKSLQLQIKLYLKSLQLQIKFYLKNLQLQKNIYIQNLQFQT